jgi:hypothetical protein
MLALMLAAAAVAPARAIDPGRSRIADSAELAAGATAVRLQGAVHCGGCVRFTLGATVSQSSSGAVGQGGVRCACHSSEERWRLTARTREATRFRPGAARVCVWIIARGSAGTPIDARQWCESVKLRLAAT